MTFGDKMEVMGKPSETRALMITLHTFGPFMGTPDSSPYVMKTMVLLRMAKVEFLTAVGNPFSSPTKFLPYIVDGKETIPDSTQIRFYLEKKYRADFDPGLIPAQKALAWTVERMCEDHLYFAMLESRWLDRKNFRKGLGKYMFKPVPLPLRPFAKSFLIGLNRKRLQGQGIGRLDRATIANLGLRDIEALSEILGDKPYITGDLISGADATVFGTVAAILVPPLESPLREAVRAKTNLVAYHGRMMAQFFPNFSMSPKR